LPIGAHVVFDYANPIESITDPKARAAREALAARVAAAGEPLRTHFDTDALRARLGEIGFRKVDDLGPAEIASRYFGKSNGASRGAGHVMHASTI